MRKPENERAFALRLTVPVLTALSLIFYRVLTASSFESTENAPLVTVLLAAAAAAFAAGRASYVAFYLTGDVMNTGLSVFFILTCVALVLAVALSIAAMAAGSRKAR